MVNLTPYREVYFDNCNFTFKKISILFSAENSILVTTLSFTTETTKQVQGDLIFLLVYSVKSNLILLRYLNEICPDEYYH